MTFFKCLNFINTSPLAVTTTNRLKKEKHYIDALIISGICALIIEAVLFLKTRDINDGPLVFVFLFLIPCALTLGLYAFTIASIHSEKLKHRILKRLIAAKVVSICLSVALIFFQLFFVSGWVMNFTNRHTPIDMKLLGYFMLVGLICNVWLLYRVTDTRKRLNTFT